MTSFHTVTIQQSIINQKNSKHNLSPNEEVNPSFNNNQTICLYTTNMVDNAIDHSQDMMDLGE